MKIPEINFPNNDKNFIHDPYPYLSDLREASPLHIDTNSNLTLIPRFDDVKHVQTSKLFSSSDPKDVMMSDKEGDKGLISKMADNGPVQYEVITAGTSIRYGTGNQFLFGGQLEAGNWYHLIVTSDGSAKNIYINNQLIESGTFESMTSNGDNLYIGAHQPLAMPGWSWSGFIDEVSIWDIAFTQNDIDAYATNSLSGNENGLVSYYKFNEGSGSTLIDDGPNGINGNINGAVWSTEVPNLPILGCTVPYASNYDANANADNGSCIFEANNFSK